MILWILTKRKDKWKKYQREVSLVMHSRVTSQVYALVWIEMENSNEKILW